MCVLRAHGGAGYTFGAFAILVALPSGKKKTVVPSYVPEACQSLAPLPPQPQAQARRAREAPTRSPGPGPTQFAVTLRNVVDTAAGSAAELCQWVDLPVLLL